MRGKFEVRIKVKLPFWQVFTGNIGYYYIRQLVIDTATIVAI
jgi:hypothetical protein